MAVGAIRSSHGWKQRGLTRIDQDILASGILQREQRDRALRQRGACLVVSRFLCG